MLLREMMLDSLQSMGLPVQAGGAPGKADGDRPVFGDVLDGTIRAKEKNAAAPGDSSAAGARKGNTGEAADNGPQFKTLREAQNQVRREVKKCDVRAKAGTEKEDPAAGGAGDGEKKPGGASADRLVNCFAQILGLSPGEFEKLLKAADITPEELAGATDVQRLVDKLAGVLGLDAKQSGTLKDVLEMVKTQAGTPGTAGDANPQTTAAVAGKLQAGATGPTEETKDSPAVEVVRTANSPDSAFSALTVKMKLKLRELQEKLDNGKEDLAGEIQAKLAVAPEQADGPEEPTPDASAMQAGDGVEAAGAGGGAAESGDNRNSGNSKEGKNGKETVAADEKPAVEAAAPAADSDPDRVAVTAPGQVQRTEEAVQVEKLNTRAPVQPREIISQVLEKAKVILTGDRSEMVMDLKPDSLGKLSLKVVTEHGMVMAKFVAESQQVKQVLETNMQLLKDSLEKQGMNVQGFSVSVEQDQQQGYRGQNEADLPGRTARGMQQQRPALAAERLTAAADGLGALQRNNPYILYTSTVSFTA